ncbi:hypothetical protein B0H66DRAFT_68593 [Apodospora peruviana]|uniref:Uncharacterized protein n=1 Tax=Apodospora peruviana TaxID=516989 RepID=A0AAE0MFE9_9PEZI|nr:hypothetical protein B0H66DRAFT_68593 [Apodospora peruviana]
MADEPSLPTLPPPLATSSAVMSFLGDRRKRARGMNTPSSLSTSSDPAVFSSDDDPALDNYVYGRRKKRYVGTWYDQHPASSDSADSAMGDDMRPPLPKPPKRQFRRQLDSGVYLGLEVSTDTDESFDLEPRAAKLPLSAKPPLLQSVARTRLSLEEVEAQRIIQSCVDTGKEEVDLSDLRLQSIANGILEPLSELTPIPTIAKDVAFEQKDPSIKLFLGNNSLRQFPLAILGIEYLTVLSLRANCLTEIPPAIALLKNLQTLNVAQNSLRFLPAELLDLMKKGGPLCSFQFHPNPFYQPQELSYCRWGAADYEERTFSPNSEVEVESIWTGITTTLQARTPVQFSDSARRICSDFCFPPENTPVREQLVQEDFWEVAVPKDAASRSLTQGPDPVMSRRGPPSLFEVALRAAMRAPELDELSSLLVDEGIPPHLPAAVDRAVQIHRMGGQTCCVCQRRMLSPVTEWIEFREVQRTSVKLIERGGTRTEVEQSTRMAANWVPFVRRGCSWNCIPYKAREPPSSEERTRLLVMPVS